MVLATPAVPTASAGLRAAVSTVRDGGSSASVFARGEGARATTATPATDRTPAAKSEATLVSLDVPTTDNATNAPRGRGGDARRSVAPQDGPVVVDRLSAPSTGHFGMVGVTWAAGFPEDDLRVQIQTLADGAWSDWSDLEIDQDTGPLPSDPTAAADVRAGTVPTWVDHAAGVHVRLWSDDGRSPEDVQVALIDGGTGLAQPGAPAPVAQPAAAAAAAPAGVRNASFASTGTVTAVADGTDPTPTAEPTPTADPTADPGTDPATTDPATTDTTGTTTTVATTGLPPRPRIVERAEWGVDRSSEVSCDSPNTAPDMRGLVLHHTVNANDYTAAEAPGIVRAIHLYHTKSRHWCDIGYNFLVDKYGVIYEGRRGGITKQVRGAHAGNMDVNTWTTGISMIGNFDEVSPSAALRRSVVNLMAWRLGLFGHKRASDYISIDNHRMSRIQGHRDVYASGIRPATSTACPGKYAYAWLNNGLRSQVQEVLDAAAANAPAPTPTPTPTATPTPVQPPAPSVSRLAATSRYGTAATIAQTKFDGPVPAVFLASGETFPDALSAGPAAAMLHAPILLTQEGVLPSETEAALQQLRPQMIYVIGGENAISPAVADQLTAYAPAVSRIAGQNRLGTSIRVVRLGWTSASTVYVAGGASFPDALSGGALAAHDKAPILLSDSDHARAGVLKQIERLNPARVVLLGGPLVLSGDVASEIAAAVPSAAVSRLAGADRFGTSVAIAKAGWAEAETGYIVRHDDWPDALAGVPAAAVDGGPLLLARRSCLPQVVGAEASALGLPNRVLLGGPDVIRDRAATSLCKN